MEVYDLTKPDEWETWLSAPWDIAAAQQQPLPDGALQALAEPVCFSRTRRTLENLNLLAGLSGLVGAPRARPGNGPRPDKRVLSPAPGQAGQSKAQCLQDREGFCPYCPNVLRLQDGSQALGGECLDENLVDICRELRGHQVHSKAVERFAPLPHVGRWFGNSASSRLSPWRLK